MGFGESGEWRGLAGGGRTQARFWGVMHPSSHPGTDPISEVVPLNQAGQVRLSWSSIESVGDPKATPDAHR